MTFLSRILLCIKIFFKKFKANLQLIRGIWRITKIKGPIVSIFGGARLAREHTYAKIAHQFAARLVQANISVMTGGGPGIMEAASCGAVANNKKSTSLGIGVKELNEGKNPCVQEYLEVNYLSTRKWLLTHYAKAFVIFPGGFGTLDELSEIIMLIQTKKLSAVPIILIGSDYWNYFMLWLTKEATEYKLVTEQQLQMFIVTDNLNEAYSIIKDTCTHYIHNNKQKE